MIIRPHTGPQEQFLTCPADIIFYGGGAGGGKTMAELLDPLRFVNTVKNFSCVIFRRTYPDITNPGGLWDESMKLYPHTGGVPNKTSLKWVWPATGASVKFAHLQYEQDVYRWQGAQVAEIELDELTHFSSTTFFYLMSRNRSSCGVRPYMRGTCNPDPDSWVRDMIAWWLDAEGFPIPERAGVVRWFARVNGVIEWADNKADLEILGHRPKSFTFIPALLTDNPTLTSADPDYEANLRALPSHERERLLRGNWNARAKAGSFFKREWFPIVDEAPECEASAWYWDRASTEVHEGNADPDWTVGLHLGKVGPRKYCVLEVVRLRGSPEKVQRAIKNSADRTPDADVCLAQDPGQAGVSDVGNLIAMLAGSAVRAIPETKAKDVRARPASAAAERGDISIVRAPWNNAFFSELEGFPQPKGKGHDDQVDALSGSYNYMARGEPSVRSA